jgi:hypothetical protein
MRRVTIDEAAGGSFCDVDVTSPPLSPSIPLPPDVEAPEVKYDEFESSAFGTVKNSNDDTIPKHERTLTADSKLYIKTPGANHVSTSVCSPPTGFALYSSAKPKHAHY